MIVVAIIGVLAAVAIPAFVRYMRRSKTTEANVSLGNLTKGAAAYYQSEHTTRTGGILSNRFPTTIPRTPNAIPGAKQALTEDWGNFSALNFAMGDPHYFSYAFTAAGTETDSSYTAGAYGDLDGDGTYSTFERTATVNADEEVVGGAALYSVDAIE